MPKIGAHLRIVLTAQGHASPEALFGSSTQWIGGLFNGGLEADEQQQLSRLLHKVWQHTDAGRESAA